MIVKNESHVVLETLKNICEHVKIDYWVISDTGSTDNTKQIITDFFNDKKIKGEFHDCEWRDFAYNRTYALQKAYGKTDYILFFDADDKFFGKFILPEKLTYDAYQLKFDEHMAYTRFALVSNRLKWKYIGVLHETLVSDENKPITDAFIDGPYYIESGKTGARSLVEDKYLKDAIILEKAYEEAVKNNDPLQHRYAFYCGQSYRDHNNIDKLIEWYKKRVDVITTKYDQEAYYSALMIARGYKIKQENEKHIYYLNLAIDIDPTRLDSIIYLIIYYREVQKYRLAYKYYQMLCSIENKNNMTKEDMNSKMYKSFDLYHYNKPYECSVISFLNQDYTNNIKECFELFKNKQHIPLFEKTQVLNNIHMFYQHSTNVDFDRFEFLQQFLDFVKCLYDQNKLFLHNIFDNQDEIIAKNNSSKQMKKLSEEQFFEQNKYLPEKQFNDVMKAIGHITPVVCKYDHERIKTLSNKPTVNIFLSMTTCKRYELFVNTMNSFIKCCTDIDKIDYFFCVDDNSSENDREHMKMDYPFFDYYMKTPQQKGHKQSMNIIYDKIKELKPKYWIHLEDDFMFIRRRNYVQESCEFLQNHQNAKQIVFNKHYAENIFAYNLRGGKLVDDDKYIIHEYNQNGKFDRTLWPHFSLNPSMICVDTIMELGNFDTNEIMFERAYANKFNNKGFKTAFYNDISCLHIGKPSHIQNSDTIKNAYALNNEQQY